MPATLRVTNPAGPITDRQRDFIRDLLAKTGKRMGDAGVPRPHTRGEASMLISVLQAMPVAPKVEAVRQAPPAVEVGCYAVQALGEPLRFYRVREYRGRTTIRRYSSETLIPIAPWERVEALDLIARDPKAARERFSRETGRCGYCNLRLTDPDSRAWLYGPECARQRGLPHGAHPDADHG